MFKINSELLNFFSYLYKPGTKKASCNTELIFNKLYISTLFNENNCSK